MDIKPGVVAVIGASQGVGRELYGRYMEHVGDREDVDVVAIARNEAKLSSAVNEHGGRYRKADITSEDDIRAMAADLFDSAERLGGPVRIIVGAGLHEKMSIGEHPNKRFTTAADFTHEDPASPYWVGTEERNYAVNVAGPQQAYNILAAEAERRNVQLDFVYISSVAAQHPAREGPDFEAEGNPFYAPQKREMETWLAKRKSSDRVTARAIRFGMADTDMAEHLLADGEHLIEYWHQGQDFANPLKHKDAVTLPVSVLTQDIVRLMEGHHSASEYWRSSADFNQDEVVEPALAFEYMPTVEQARARLS